jgi:hypothetical protein
MAQQDAEKCEQEFEECLRRSGEDIFRGTRDELGPTAPDRARRHAPNAVDLYSRGRGKKIR